MPRVSFTSLRSRAIILVLLAVLPVLALTLYSYFDQRALAIREVQRDELVTARNLATIHETLLRSTHQLLENLAQLPQVQRQDQGACEALFAKLMEQCPYYTALLAADPEGRVFASVPAAEDRLNISERLWFRRAVQTKDFVVGEPVLGRITNRYSLSLAHPIIDSTGRLQGVVGVGVDLHWLGEILTKSDFPPSTALVLTDSTWRVFFRYPEPQQYVGKMFPDFLIKAAAARAEGVAEGVGLPGDRRLFAFTRLSPPWQEMRVFLGLPEGWAVDKVNRDLWRNLIWLGSVAILALSAAWFGADFFIVRPVRKLRGATERLAAGDLTVRSGSQVTVGELGLLAQGFDQMADALQERDAELKRSAVELRQRVKELDQRSLDLAAANQELEAFAYSVSHDLRAPLRAIGGFARVLLEDHPAELDQESRRHLHIIQQEAQKMGRLIDDLLALTRVGRKAMNLVRLDMTELVRGIFAEVQGPEPERDLQVEIEALPEAMGDRGMLRLVWINLLLNAMKFTRGRHPAAIRVSGWTEAEEQVYCVKDNGVGFDMRYANKLFEVFQRLHPEDEFGGTGVGLAIVKRIIERHGGRVWARGQVNEGATFCFAIPKRNGS